jgi:hypothetical protein
MGEEEEEEEEIVVTDDNAPNINKSNHKQQSNIDVVLFTL